MVLEALVGPHRRQGVSHPAGVDDAMVLLSHCEEDQRNLLEAQISRDR
jgi:hypothetical protein